MKLLIISVLVAAVAADRLDNTYLPPNTAHTAGGNGNFLNAPAPATFHNNNNHRDHHQQQHVSDKYGAPSNAQPSTNYGPPSAHGNNAYNNGGSAAGPDAGAAILKFESENNGDGSYRFAYETENQITHEESGELKNAGTEQEAQSVSGSYSYMGPDGVMYTVTYVADENGFRATGDHIPTPPPVPEAIQKSLEQNAAAEASAQSQQGYTNGGYQQNSYQENNHQAQQNGYQQNGYQQSATNNGYQYQQQQQQQPQQQQHAGGNGYHANQASQTTATASRQYIPPQTRNNHQQNGYQY